MLRVTALSDFVGAIGQKHLIALAVISTVLAAAMEIAGSGQTRPITVVQTVCSIAVLVLMLSFFMFAIRNSVIVPRYGSSDLFLSAFLVVFGMALWFLTVRSSMEPGFFGPVFLLLAVVVSLACGGLLAALLPLAHKIYAGLF
jgi:hypothetical protein